MYSNAIDPREKQEEDVSHNLQNDELDNMSSEEDDVVEEDDKDKESDNFRNEED